MIVFILTNILKIILDFLVKIGSSDIFPGMVLAFIGAFFAFILHVLLSGLDREREIKKDNFMASVNLEHLCARAINSMDWNLKELKNYLKNLEDLQKNGPIDHWIELYKLALVHLPVDYDLTLRLTLLKLLQETANMFMMIDQLNIIIDSTMDAHRTDFREKMSLPDEKLPWNGKEKLLPIEIERVKTLIQQFRKIKVEIQKTLSRTNTLNPTFAKESRGFVRRFFRRYRTDYTPAEIAGMAVALKEIEGKTPEY